MHRFVLLLTLATTTALAQTSPSPKHPRTPHADTDGNWVNQQGTLQNRARQILRTELSRKVDPACDSLKISLVDFGNCFSADLATSQRNYRAFVGALKASLAVEPPDVDPEIYPASRNFSAGEVAWRSYMDKTCQALGDTDAGGNGTGLHEMDCRRKLIRQHMRDLGWIFLSTKLSDLE